MLISEIVIRYPVFVTKIFLQNFRVGKAKDLYLFGRLEMEGEITTIAIAMVIPTPFGHCPLAVPLKTDWCHGTQKLAVLL